MDPKHNFDAPGPRGFEVSTPLDASTEADLRTAKATVRDLQAQLSSCSSEREAIVEWLLTMATFTEAQTSEILRDYAVRIRHGAHMKGRSTIESLVGIARRGGASDEACGILRQTMVPVIAAVRREAYDRCANIAVCLVEPLGDGGGTDAREAASETAQEIAAKIWALT